MSHFYDSTQFESRFTYTGTDLGAAWAKERTLFRLWAPTAAAVQINLYRTGTPWNEDLIERLPMIPGEQGTWTAEKTGDLNGIYYTYLVDVGGKTLEACDPYARTTGVNGQRAMIIDLDSCNPQGWENDSDPHNSSSFAEAVIYEAHIRDFSIDASSGIQHKGKYLGMAETGTQSPDGHPTGLDHVKNLGITHLHILPMYDYGSVDESRLDIPQYNWGYDPVNFNVPEGSYATDPWNGAVRVRELKQMIKALHDNGISVVMDVVYNHVFEADNFCFNKIVPMYFSRFDESGKLLNDSCCGNDTASERSMVRKYIVDSVAYWADEYHIDGFRFDLVGLIDTDTINAVMEKVHESHPNVVFYGEGWDMYSGPAKKGMEMTVQKNGHLVPGFSFFNDSIRDQLKGTVFEQDIPGFVAGGVFDPDILSNCFLGAPYWAISPLQSVNYVSCHDNQTMMDRVTLSTPCISREKRVRMNNLAAAFYLTAQGIPFFQAGEEMLRSKPLGRRKFDENSYKSPDSVNGIKWGKLDLEEIRLTRDYYQGLIKLRKQCAVLRETTSDGHCAVETGRQNVLAFSIHGEIIAVFNAGKTPFSFILPQGEWDILVNHRSAGTESLGNARGKLRIPGISAMILRKK